MRRRVCLNFDRVIWCFVDVADIVLVVGRPRRHGDMMLDSFFFFLWIVRAGQRGRVGAYSIAASCVGRL